MFRRILCACIILITGNPVLYAQEDQLIDIEFSCPEFARAGDSITVRVDFNVKEGWHVYAPLPVNENQGMYGTKLNIEFLQNKSVEKGNLSFSEPELSGAFSVFKGRGHMMEQQLFINKTFQGDTINIQGNFQYQACDDRRCLPPAYIRLDKKIVIRRDNHLPEPENLSNERVGPLKVNDAGTAVVFFTAEKTVNMVLKDLKNKVDYSLGYVHNNVVLTDDYCIARNYQQKELYLVDLRKPKLDTIRNVSDYQWLPMCRTIIYQKDDQQVVIRELNSGKTTALTDIKMFSAADEKKKILFVKKDGEVILLDLLSNRQQKYDSEKRIASASKKIIWDQFFNEAFIFSHSKEDLYILKLDDGSLIKVFQQPLIDKGSIIDTTFLSAILLSDSRIALGVKKYIEKRSPDKRAEIWLGSTKGITPVVQQHIDRIVQLAIVDWKNQQWVNLYEQDKWLEFRINANNGTVYCFERNGNEDQTKQYADLDVYFFSKDLLKKHLIGKFNGDEKTIRSFASSPHLFYFMGKHWFYYNHQDSSRVNITENLSDIFYDNRGERYLISTGECNYLYSVNEKGALLFTGMNDIWMFDTKKMDVARKTNGATESKSYEVSICNYALNDTKWGWSLDADIDAYDDIVLTWKSQDYSREGISVLNKDGKLIAVVEDSAHFMFNQIKRSANFILYRKEKPDFPAGLFLYDIKKKKEILIYRSNQSDTASAKVKRKFLQWKNEKGETRSATVFLPLGYDPGKKYPAIVDIYEKKRGTQNMYSPPGEMTGNGINYRHYINDGYFVIKPDIFYEIGNPGISSFKCVDETIDGVLKHFSVDPEKLGLIGHSFGGYQTNFIITQTNRFKTAISSAGIADFVNLYFTYSHEYFRPDSWRCEDQQFRMGKSFYEMPDRYIANSPVHHAQNVQTPLLLITGKEDYVVNWNQSLYMFNALKRVKSEVNLLLYAGEGHSFLDHQNILDGSKKIRSWFDYYLKGNVKPVWLGR